MDYREAEERLKHAGHGKEMPRRKLQNNTYLERLDVGTIGLLLHYTYIARFRDDGSVILDTGGWYTVTTKDRYSWVSGWTVFSGRHHHRAETCWWLRPINYRTWADGKEGWVPFFDGIHVHQHTGAVLSSDQELEDEMAMRDPGPTKRQMVREYLTLFTDPDKMARTAEKAINRSMRPKGSWLAHSMLQDHYVDLGVVYEALKVDAARRGELDRPIEQEALTWLDLLSEGQEPPRVRSIIRDYITYLESA